MGGNDTGSGVGPGERGVPEGTRQMLEPRRVGMLWAAGGPQAQPHFGAPAAALQTPLALVQLRGERPTVPSSPSALAGPPSASTSW